MAFLHTTIQVKDLEKSIEFYRDYVGLEVLDRFGGPEREIAFMGTEPGATAVELIAATKAKKYRGEGISIGFGVADLERAREKAMDMGLKPGDVIEVPGNIKFFFLSDPNGVSVQILESDKTK